MLRRSVVGMSKPKPVGLAREGGAAVFQLPSGNGPEVSGLNGAATPVALLEQVESMIDAADGKLRLEKMPGGITCDLRGRTLAQLADSLMARI